MSKRHDEMKAGEREPAAMDRREFFGTLAVLAGGAAAAAAAPPDAGRPEAAVQVVPPDDPRLVTERIEYPGATGPMKAYLARPAGEGRHPAVIVIHENRGLVPHIEDVARRVALEGYLAIAPDALSPFGGTPAETDEARPLFSKLDRDQNIRNFTAAAAYLDTHPLATGKVGCMGFCWGGAVTNQVAVHAPELDAAVPFYGAQPAPGDAAKIKAAMLIHYAGDDERINAGIEAFEVALKKAGVDFRIHVYEGAAHAFFNDTSERYNPEAAKLAWQRTLAFFARTLKT